MAPQPQPVELIQTRGLMSSLTTPAFLIDLEGNLVFFNDPAGELLGLRYEEAGRMGPQEWGTKFEPTHTDGSPFPVEDLPLSRALGDGLPAHERMHIKSVTGVESDIEVCAFPITGVDGTHGALAIFWLLGENGDE